jgi:hypothetical protein
MLEMPQKDVGVGGAGKCERFRSAGMGEYRTDGLVLPLLYREGRRNENSNANHRNAPGRTKVQSRLVPTDNEHRRAAVGENNAANSHLLSHFFRGRIVKAKASTKDSGVQQATTEKDSISGNNNNNKVCC